MTQTHNTHECWCGIDHELERRIADHGTNAPVTPEDAALLREQAQSSRKPFTLGSFLYNGPYQP